MSILNVTCRLDLTPEQQEAVEATLTAFAQACNHAAAAGKEAGTTCNARIHHLTYRDLRRRYRLSANLTIRAIARAASLLKEVSGAQALQPPTRIDYDARILSLSAEACTVSLSSVRGRLRGIQMVLDAHERRQLSMNRPSRVVLHKTPDQEYILHFELKEAVSRLEDPIHSRS